LNYSSQFCKIIETTEKTKALIVFLVRFELKCNLLQSQLAGPSPWNSLPSYLHEQSDTTLIKARHKSFSIFILIFCCNAPLVTSGVRGALEIPFCICILSLMVKFVCWKHGDEIRSTKTLSLGLVQWTAQRIIESQLHSVI
jgi:hypothetical protein